MRGGCKKERTRHNSEARSIAIVGITGVLGGMPLFIATRVELLRSARA